jgi:hypothetical protein
MMTAIVISGLILFAALIGFAMYCCYRAGREDGYEQGRADRLVADDVARRGRHAKSQPRASTSPASAAADSSSAPKPTRTALVRSGYRDSWRAMYPPTGGPVELPRSGSIAVFLARHQDAVTAEDIEEVLLPGSQASPDLNGADDTGRMIKVTDTGDLPKITDAWIAENIRPEVIA